MSSLPDPLSDVEKAAKLVARTMVVVYTRVLLMIALAYLCHWVWGENGIAGLCIAYVIIFFVPD
jgi:hypothetical protein